MMNVTIKNVYYKSKIVANQQMEIIVRLYDGIGKWPHNPASEVIIQYKGSHPFPIDGSQFLTVQIDPYHSYNPHTCRIAYHNGFDGHNDFILWYMRPDTKPHPLPHGSDGQKLIFWSEPLSWEFEISSNVLPSPLSIFAKFDDKSGIAVGPGNVEIGDDNQP